jgi:hypothetical protein
MSEDPRRSQSILRVGGGRGFVIEKDGARFVITAAHCLTAPVTVRGDFASKGATLPPAYGASYSEERTYPHLLGPLGAKPRVPAECLFVDPVADVAVLGPVDVEELYDHAQAYEELVEAVDPLPLGSLTFGYRRHPGRSLTVDGRKVKMKGFVDLTPIAESDAWLLALDGHWFRCRVTSRGRALWIREAEEDIRSGMSGSPIISPARKAVGVLCTSSHLGGRLRSRSREGGPNPFLAAQLPGWLADGLLKIPRRPSHLSRRS